MTRWLICLLLTPVAVSVALSLIALNPYTAIISVMLFVVVAWFLPDIGDWLERNLPRRKA